jgi:hypothetical protein
MSLDALKELMQREPDAWLRQTMQYFREFGFLTITDEEAKTAMLRGWDAIIPADASDNPQYADLFLLAECRAPVWWGDLERIYPDTSGYADLLREWAAIARGAFAPDDIEEIWAADQKSAEVAFTHHGVRRRFTHSERNGDFVDMAIVKLINELIKDTPHQFEICDMGMPNFVLVLTAPEKTRLKRERSWRFEDMISDSSH